MTTGRFSLISQIPQPGELFLACSFKQGVKQKWGTFSYGGPQSREAGAGVSSWQSIRQEGKGRFC